MRCSDTWNARTKHYIVVLLCHVHDKGYKCRILTGRSYIHLTCHTGHDSRTNPSTNRVDTDFFRQIEYSDDRGHHRNGAQDFQHKYIISFYNVCIIYIYIIS